jgi:hypothetical protein
MTKHLEFLETSIGASEVMDSTNWMSEGLSTLDRKEKSFHGRTGTFELRVFVFKNFFIQAFEAILIRGEVTLEEARLIDTIVQNYLSDGLLVALHPSEAKTIQKLLLPFAQSPTNEVADEKGLSVTTGTDVDYRTRNSRDALLALSQVRSHNRVQLHAAMDGHKICNTPDYAKLVCFEMDRNPYSLTAAQIELAKTFETHIH